MIQFLALAVIGVMVAVSVLAGAAVGGIVDSEHAHEIGCLISVCALMLQNTLLQTLGSE